MIRKQCDNCERWIEVEDDLAGQKVSCGACGDINLMPAAVGVVADSGPVATSAAARDKPGRLGLPPDSGPEQHVLKVRPAMIRARPGLFLAHLFVIIAGLAGAGWGLVGPASGFRTAALALGAAGTVIAGASLGVWKIKTLGAALEITNKRTVMRTGLLSRATSEVVHDNIRNVQVVQTFWQRIWKVGTLGLSSSGQDGIEIEIGDIPDPDRVREVIDAYRPLG
ncbi:MAG: PH domain-containing protein [Phycisphaerales bacterium]|nr:PH domain-containing protein [Phycisphaerales bacterium]